MSKLVKRLRQISEGATQPLGFRAGATPPRQSMLLMAALLPANDDRLSEVASTEVDAILVCTEDLEYEIKALQRIANTVGNIPWGTWSKAITTKSIGQLIEAGGDFLVFEAATTPAVLLQQKEIGKVLKIGLPFDDNLIRTVERLPIDATFINITGDDGKLKVSHLMYCQRLADLISKPLLVMVQQELADKEIQALRDRGVIGVVVEVGQEKPRERLLQLRQRIKDLPPATPRRESREVILPRLERERGSEIPEEI